MTHGRPGGLKLPAWLGNISALRSAGFRRYAAVQLLSATSVASQMVAELWLVYQITGQGLSLGTSTAIRTAPALVLAGVAGALADRFPRKLLLTLTQGARCVLTAGFALVTLGDLPAISTVYLLVLGLGCTQGIDQPVRRALVRDVVDRRTLPSAASLHTATISVGGIVGPLAAGLLMATVSPVAAFVLSSALALGAVAFVRALRLVDEPDTPSEPLPDATSDGRAEETEEAAEALPVKSPAEGSGRVPWRRIWSPGLRPTFLFLLSLSVFAMNLNVLLPVIAAEVLSGGSGTYSVLHTFLRSGALVGSLLAAAAATRVADHRRIFWALALCGAALATVATGTHLATAAVTIVATGLGAGLFLSMASAGVQTGADRAVQGRQVAVYSFIFIGGRTLGAPLTGWLADHLGAQWATLVLGAGTLAGALAVHASRLKHRYPTTPADQPRQAAAEPE